jgi:hypothetical protein
MLYNALFSAATSHCCSGFAPNLFIQVVKNTQLETFLKGIGFQSVPGAGLMETIESGFKFEAF